MKIILTGATGFLGKALCSSFLHHGHDVIVTQRNSSHPIASAILDICGTNKEELADTFKKHADIDIIVHAATDYGRAAPLPTAVFWSNIEFPMRLLEWGMSAAGKTFINIDTFFNTAQTSYQYLGEYTLSKRHFQEWGEVCGRRGKIRFINLRLFHLYGPGDKPEKFVPTIVDDCLRDKKINLTDGTQRRDFIYINDAVEAINIAIQSEAGKPGGYQHYDIGTGQSHSIREFVEMVKGLSSSNSILNFGALPNRMGEFTDARADAYALQEIGWSPSTSLENGLLATIANHKQRLIEEK